MFFVREIFSLFGEVGVFFFFFRRSNRSVEGLNGFFYFDR